MESSEHLSSEEVSQQREEVSQQREEVSQQRAEVSQQREEVSQQRAEVSQQRAEVSQQREEVSQQRAEVSQQREAASQQREAASQQREAASQLRADYFEMLAGMGITKHIGSLTATLELVGLCHIDQDSYVLDVGCGIGATPIYLAKKYGCRVVGIDITEGMIARSHERLRGTGLEDRVEFRVADAQYLPFEDATFDAVMAESVLAFIDDRTATLKEWMRVTKPGGYIGFTEATWTKTPPKDLDEYMYRTTAGKVEVAEVWEDILNGSGLTDTVAGAYKVDMKAEASGRIERLGLKTSLAALPRVFSVLLKNPGSRKVLTSALSFPKGIFECMGYGVYAGRKGE